MSKHFGYLRADRVEGVKTFSQVYSKAAKEGHGAGGSKFLYEFYERATGHPFPTRNQGSTPSCVGHAVAGGVDILRGVRIGGLGVRKEKFDYPACATTIYGGSRYEIGYKKHGIKGMIRGGGSRIPFAIEYMQDYGTLYMRDYGDGYDLSEFSEKRCSQWGAKGVPDALESKSRLRMLLGFHYVETVEEAISALAYGFPIVFGADQGFDGQKSRDAEGFLKPRGSWAHAQMLHGYSDNPKRPYFKMQNSWGDWIKGPNTDNGPVGSYNVDFEVVEKMMKGNEFAALSNMDGFGV